MPVNNLDGLNTTQPTLEEFEIDPAQLSNANFGSTDRHYQVSNLIVQDPTRTGVLQFFPEHSGTSEAPLPETQGGNSIRPNRTGGSSSSTYNSEGA